METVVIADGSAGRVTHRFNWNRPTFELPPGVPGMGDFVLFADWEARPVYIRDDVDVKLTVTDVRGATATAVQRSIHEGDAEAATPRQADQGEGDDHGGRRERQEGREVEARDAAPLNDEGPLRERAFELVM
jgi:hypothetical protein